MLRRFTPLFPLFIAALLAGATWWLEHLISNQPGAQSKAGRTTPDAIVENFQISRYKATGELNVNLTGERMEHFPVDDRAEIDKPVLDFVGVNTSRNTRVQSDRASVTKRGDLVELIGHVEAEREGQRGKPATRLQTERLFVLPRDEIAYTSAPLAATQGRLHMNGVGAEWNNLTGLLKVWNLDATLQRENKP